MSQTAESILASVQAHIQKALPKESKGKEITRTTSLIKAGMMDSVAVLKMVDGFETEFGVEFDPSELSAEYLDTPDLIVKLLEQKIAKK